jgi:hypothetical protein
MRFLPYRSFQERDDQKRERDTRSNDIPGQTMRLNESYSLMSILSAMCLKVFHGCFWRTCGS